MDWSDEIPKLSCAFVAVTLAWTAAVLTDVVPVSAAIDADSEDSDNMARAVSLLMVDSTLEMFRALTEMVLCWAEVVDCTDVVVSPRLAI